MCYFINKIRNSREQGEDRGNYIFRQIQEVSMVERSKTDICRLFQIHKHLLEKLQMNESKY